MPANFHAFGGACSKARTFSARLIKVMLDASSLLRRLLRGSRLVNKRKIMLRRQGSAATISAMPKVVILTSLKTHFSRFAGLGKSKQERKIAFGARASLRLAGSTASISATETAFGGLLVLLFCRSSERWLSG